MDFFDNIKGILWKLIPHIHNLDEVIYTQWFGYDWFIEK